MTTAYLLARVSTDQQEKDGAGLDAQLAAMQQVAARFNTDKIKEVREAISGYMETIVERPILQRTLNAAAEGDIFIWHRSARIARDKDTKSAILKALQKKKLRCIVGGREYDLSNDEDRLVLTFFGGIDEYTGRILVKRMQEGRTQWRKSGHIVDTSCPFGLKYIKSDNRNERTFAVVPEQAESIRKIVELYLDGTSLSSIAAELSRLGIKTKRGHTWESIALSRLLRNPMIAGRQYHNRFLVKLGEDGKTIKSRTVNPDKDSWLLVTEFEPIVPWKKWQTIQKRLDLYMPRTDESSAKAGRPANDKHTLSGKVLCGNCNSAMSLAGSIKDREGNTIRYYSCRWRDKKLSKTHGKIPCSMPGIPAKHAEELVWQAARKAFLGPRVFFMGFASADANDKEINNAKKTLTNLKKNLTSNDAMIENTADRLASVKIGSPREKTFSVQLERLETKSASLQKQVAEVATRIGDLEEIAERQELVSRNKDTLKAIQKIAAKTVDTLSPKNKKQLVNAFLGGLRLRAELIPAKAWKKWVAITPDEGFLELDEKFRISPDALDEPKPTQKTKGRIDAFKKEVAKGTTNALNLLANTGRACAPNSKAAGCGWRLVPEGKFHPFMALSGLVQFCQKLKPALFKQTYNKDNNAFGGALG